MNQISLKSINTTVVFLNDNQHCFKFNKQAKGHELLNAVFQHLDLVENEYFGLKFSENVQNPFMANTDDMRWLNPEKSIKKQMRGCSFYFGVKYYASNPNSLLEITRYQLYLQLRKDILLGKLFISFSSACILGSYTIQSEFGDFSEEVHKPGYLSKFIFIQEQSEELEHQISELHKIHKGLSKSDAVMNFLDHSKHLSMYGIHLYKAKDSNNKNLEIGVVSNGIVIFQNNIRINTLSWSKIIKLSFKRKHFFVRLRKETSEDYDTILGLNMMTNRSSKHLWTTCVEYYSFFQLHKLHIQSNSQGFRKFLLGLRFSYSRQTETQSVEENYNPKQHTFFRFKSKTMSKQPVKNNTENKNKNCIIKSTTSKGSHDNKIKSFDIEPKLAWDNSCICNDENELKITPICPENIINDKAMKNHDIITSNIYDIPAYEMESLDSDENIVCINLNSDEEGRFGFNVKGGSDLGLPIIVSRVVPNTPAHRSEPKLYEGDQILMINGQELSHMVHDKIINLIQSAKDLILTVKQTSNDHCRKLLEEPFFQYIPDSLKIMSSDPLEQSILLLGDSLASGSILKQFEQLYRHKPNTSMDKAKSVHNKNKNRYLDIAPYDYTRYVLKDIENDYINASHINMNIPGSGIINQYIATQGPLQATVNDFWTMVLESRSSVIVMLTALIEKRHHKCFKYWPDLNESLEFNNLLVKTVSEETNNTSNNIVYRKINLTEIISNETRSITHLQFNSWPDHGVPEDSNCLLNLVEAIRKLRTGIVEPIIIHCSAGVGRTGVIILLDTALCLIEANQPVFPLEIVRQMRDQRAMMVQTKNQYKFVCNCIYHAYTQGQVKPLPEYK